MLRGIKFKRSVTAALISISSFGLIAPAQALVPYVYLPTEVELSGSSLGIGRTAAQLLQMGQPKEAAQLAAEPARRGALPSSRFRTRRRGSRVLSLLVTDERHAFTGIDGRLREC